MATLLPEHSQLLYRALRSMADVPAPLLETANALALGKVATGDLNEHRFVEYLEQPEVQERLRNEFHQMLNAWDRYAGLDAWSSETDARSKERRSRCLEMLGLVEFEGRIAKIMPIAVPSFSIISEEFEPWYPIQGTTAKPFYWEHYRNFLGAKRGWEGSRLDDLDAATTAVVERLSDPTRLEEYSARGLVVGHVQSGKTANYTGVLAKSIDAGYRLIIVLSGTVEILRQQTQRRLDMELVGVENITLGRDKDDEDLVGDVEYLDDEDWISGMWVTHGGNQPSIQGGTDIQRLTTHPHDYRKLAQRIALLDDKKIDRSKPLFDPVNLYRADARIAVVKKNKSRLSQLVKDLKTIKVRLAQIPAIIIDDESDQASINTTNPKTWSQNKKERTAINKQISELLTLLPRAQYIGYTATPFANCFVDADDAADIFPRDFFIPLDKPQGYMGASDFFDDPDDEDARNAESRSFENSNELAFTRSLEATDEAGVQVELREALDAFLLTGAVKLFRREGLGGTNKFRHHTMLIHESVRVQEHELQSLRVSSLWSQTQMLGAKGLKRLEKLWEEDVRLVSQVRAPKLPMPQSFEILKPFLAEAFALISPNGEKPFVIVNGDKDLGEDVDFDRHPIWKILIGGAKLSRGFTVEGLTVSYYKRLTRSTDSLLQMGRWFGYRTEYHDLVRLYISRSVQQSSSGSTVDLYEAFRGAMMDEEALRADLRRYATLVDGVPQLRPKQVAPIVSSHLSYLPPTSRNKMFNHVIAVERTTGIWSEPNAYPKDSPSMRHNFEILTPVVRCASNLINLPAGDGSGDFQARVGVISHGALLELLDQVSWSRPDYWKAKWAFLRECQTEGTIQDWLVVLPYSKSDQSEDQLAENLSAPLFRRKRRPEREDVFGFISEKRHRIFDSFVSGTSEFEALKPYDSKTRGVLLVYCCYDGDKKELSLETIPEWVSILFGYHAPYSYELKTRPLVQYTQLRPGSDSAVVDIEDAEES